MPPSSSRTVSFLLLLLLFLSLAFQPSSSAKVMIEYPFHITHMQIGIWAKENEYLERLAMNIGGDDDIAVKTTDRSFSPSHSSLESNIHIHGT